MQIINFLKIFLSGVWAFMVYIVVATCLENNLFEQWDFLGSIPWMRATLWDFYANVLVIFLWVVYKESKVWLVIVWAVLFFCLGSIGTIGYVLIQLFRLKDGETIVDVLSKKNA